MNCLNKEIDLKVSKIIIVIYSILYFTHIILFRIIVMIYLNMIKITIILLNFCLLHSLFIIFRILLISICYLLFRLSIVIILVLIIILICLRFVKKRLRRFREESNKLVDFLQIYFLVFPIYCMHILIILYIY